ncbi:MAG: tetratricopeptide repeat protein [bacterium]|nr:tetratricopeptide repeat protein [bacterium]
MARWSPWLVGLFALSIRCFYYGLFWTSNPFAEKMISDARIYDDWAQRIAAGDWRSGSEVFILPPLYPYIVGFFYAVFGYAPKAVVAIQALSGCVSAALVCRLGQRHFCLGTGVIGGLLFSVYGPQLFFESMMLGNSGAVLLCLVGMTCLCEWMARMPASNGPVGLAGFVFGLAALMRPNVLSAVPFLMFGLGWMRRGVTPDGFRLKWAGWFLIGLAVPLLVCGLRNGMVTGDWVLITAHGGINFYMGNHEGAPGWFSAPEGMDAQITPQGVQGNLAGPRRVAEKALDRPLTASEVSAFWFRRGWDFWLEHPFRALKLTAHKLRLFLSGYEIPLNYNFYSQRKHSFLLRIPLADLWFIFPLALVGMAVAARRAGRHALLYLWFAGYAAGVILFHVSSRYRTPVIPVVMVFAGLGVWTLFEWLHSRQWKKLGAVLGILALLWTGYRFDLSGWLGKTDMGMDAYNLGTSYLWENENEKALEFLQEAALYPNGEGARQYNLGLAHARLGHRAEARSAYRKALILDPERMEIYVNLGNIMFREGNFPEAIGMYMDVLKRYPRAHNARANMGWALLSLGRAQEAREAWNTVLQNVPDHPSAREGMARLGPSP